MATNPTSTTAELPVSKTKEEIVREAQRIEEALLCSSKSHFNASELWTKFHFCIGIPMVVLSALAGAAALKNFAYGNAIAGCLSLIISVLSALMTFLNPNDKVSAHFVAGNKYDSLMNRVRIFWSIDCWREDSEQLLTERLKDFSVQKDALNQNSPQPSRWAYRRAQRGIEAGEALYKVDRGKL